MKHLHFVLQFSSWIYANVNILKYEEKFFHIFKKKRLKIHTYMSDCSMQFYAPNVCSLNATICKGLDHAKAHDFVPGETVTDLLIYMKNSMYLMSICSGN